MHDGKLPLLHRLSHKREGGLWGLPAGKAGIGEVLEEAMSRELMEETGLTMTPSQFTKFGSVWVRHDTFDFEYHMFSLTVDSLPEIVISVSEHDEVRWVTPEESLTMPLVRDQDECIRMFFNL